MSDPELLQRYTQQGSHAAFAELVERHLNLVYSVARRHLGSTAQAGEVAWSTSPARPAHLARLVRLDRERPQR